MKHVLLAALAAASTAHADPVTYHLDVAKAGQGFNCAAINAHGDVAGTAVRDSETAYSWDAVAVARGHAHAIGWSTGGQPAEALGINADRLVVGDVVTRLSNGGTRAATWTPAGSQTLLPDYGVGSGATGVNRDGDIVGWAVTTHGSRHAVRWSGGQIVDLTPHAVAGAAYAINDRGQAVGTAAKTGYTPVMFADGAVVPLGSIGGTWGFAFAINNAGHAVGTATIAGDSIQHAFVSSDGVMRDLGVLPGGTSSAATGINASEVIVGDADDEQPYPEGVVWIDGQIHRLTDLLEPATRAAGWQVWAASAINDRGQICASGNGIAVVLTPLP